jgi:hypothetical protein
VLVLQGFPDISLSEFAPNEAEIEIYASPSGDYMEVEQQGAYLELMPGQSLTLETIWRGTLLPSSTLIEDGSPSLIEQAEALAQSL